MKKAFCFDLFWTLVAPHFQEKNTEFEAAGLSKADFESVFEEKNFCLRRNLGEFKSVEEITEEYAELSGICFTAEQKKSITAGRLERLKNCLLNVDEKILSVLEELKKRGYILCLISNADNFDYYYWNSSPLKNYFDSVTFSGLCKSVKPESGIYKAALEKNSLKAEECFFCGDGGHNELRGAKELGFTTVFTEYLLKKNEEVRKEILKSADFVIQDFEELLEIEKQF